MKAEKDSQTWELVKLPESQSAVVSKCKIRTKTGGSIEKYKYPLVAQGFTQKHMELRPILS